MKGLSRGQTCAACLRPCCAAFALSTHLRSSAEGPASVPHSDEGLPFQGVLPPCVQTQPWSRSWPPQHLWQLWIQQAYWAVYVGLQMMSIRGRG